MKRTTIVSAIAPLLLIYSAFSAGEERTEIAGRCAMEYSKREMLNVPDTQGHIVAIGEAKGKNVNTGKTDYMDDAEVLNLDLGDLVNGTGWHQGYITLAKDGSQTVTQWKGQVTTVLSSEGQPLTSFEGTWQLVNGTGSYANAKGEGIYRGHFVSPTSYVVDWAGHYLN